MDEGSKVKHAYVICRAQTGGVLLPRLGLAQMYVARDLTNLRQVIAFRAQLDQYRSLAIIVGKTNNISLDSLRR